ncbi:MAG: reductive dehalogenase [Candidatus Sumerlaeota bacterium]|nr:reductive dehalogenase [Candidatus Sumerlaeota bacterium]
MSDAVAVSLQGKYYRRRGFKTLDKPAYVKDIVEPLGRYSEKRTPLSRGYVPPGGWDEELLKTLVPVIGQQGPLPRNEPGYTQIDLAQRIAGFHIAMAANCHTGNWTRPPLSEEQRSFYDWEGKWGPSNPFLPWQPEKLPVDDPEAISEIVKDTALFLGASLVGITEINPRWIYHPGWDRYAHKEVDVEGQLPPGVKYAVVMAVETNYDFVRHAPTAKASAAAGLGYSKMAFLTPSVAKFIGMLGYKAVACGNDTGLSIPLAVDAGLGQLGRLGALITPEFGPRVRLCKVLTDLPLIPTKPIDFGVTEFCEACEKCAEYCPAQAILYGKRTHKARTVSNNPGLLKWPLNGERCIQFWYKNGAKTDKGMYHVDCYQCINVCPFNKKPGLGHDLVRWSIRHLPFLNKLLKYGDDLFYKPLYKTGAKQRRARGAA